MSNDRPRLLNLPLAAAAAELMPPKSGTGYRSEGINARTVHANGLEFAVLEAGSGPLALCLHGFPDCAHTWRHLLPELAAAGYHAVAPFMRGYAPTGVPTNGDYRMSTVAADAVALHDVLNGTSEAVLIGHDWGAEAAYRAAAAEPERWRRLVTLAVPPAGLDAVLFADFEQLKRFWYIFMFRDPGEFAADIVAADDLAFADRLWRDWSPGFDAREHLALVKDSLRTPANLAAAIGYYRAAGDAIANAAIAPQPTLYLHGAADGCIGAEFAASAPEFLGAGSRVAVVDGAGHFLQLERPAEVNAQIVNWITN
ncbi:MAG TPA: alpha/beta hydrolase [Streptosporangiaceae bacterium]|nr:alpha/beta hydrolase [Streptosporangiaceae bacterium]